MEEHGAKLEVIGADDARWAYELLCENAELDTGVPANNLPFREWSELIYSQSLYYRHGDTLISLRMDQQNRTAMFGMFCKNPGVGSGQAAFEALCNQAFLYLGMQRLWCLVRVDNDMAMHAIAKQALLQHEGTLRSALYRNGRFIDLDIFAILGEDWRAR